MKNLKCCFTLFLFLSINFYTTKAQDTELVIRESERENSNITELPTGMNYSVDSLLSDWKARTYITLTSDCNNTSNINPVYPDSVYITRMSSLPTIMELAYNDIVRRYIDLYTGRMRKQVSIILSSSNFYTPIIEEALDAYDLPIELKYLPIIESAMNPSAISRMGASGLWQFMIKTGKIYGLESNSLVDERRDPIKSSWAAARHLKDLYNIYKDWNLVIAAYNCGPGNVNKAIRRSGGKTDYWSIYPYLPRETRGYVPAFIAVNYVMNYYCEHNICPMETTLPSNTDTIQIDKRLHFAQITDICGISMEQIESLNPQYKKSIIPGGKPYTLCLPHESLSVFIDKQDVIYEHRVKELFGNRLTVEASKKRNTTSGGNYTSTNGITYHKIRNGESLSTIARKYQVNVSDLKKWNNLDSNTIITGKQLKILN
ncbi:Membrane-bound lytic murein transglycosylase D [termite gut metagenome]|uniref:Membrane-bound lytic murein transglycosylase D n=1 Tax=termite gut metagenome TaxID=433724 RepID=A0A5J4SXZ8_9ZZZZ